MPGALTGSELANGARGASYVQSYFSEFDFDYGVNQFTDEQLASKYNLDAKSIEAAKEFYHAGNRVELDRLLAANATVHVETPAPEQANEDVLPEITPEPVQEYGYIATPLHGYIFVKPLPPEHKGRLITTKAYESNSDMGFIHAVGDEVTKIKPGQLVLYDKYAAEQEKFQLLDEDGDPVTLIKLYQANITAVLDRVKTKAFRQ